MKPYFTYIDSLEGNFRWAFKFEAKDFEDASKHFDEVYEFVESWD